MLRGFLRVKPPPLWACAAPATAVVPAGELPAKGFWDAGTAGGIIGAYSGTAPGNATMSFQALALSGGSQPHNNMQPYLTLSFCIALQGVFPPRG